MKLILTYDEYMKLLDSTGVRDMVEKLIQDSIASKMGNLITENPVAPVEDQALVIKKVFCDALPVQASFKDSKYVNVVTAGYDSWINAYSAMQQPEHFAAVLNLINKELGRENGQEYEIGDPEFKMLGLANRYAENAAQCKLLYKWGGYNKYMNMLVYFLPLLVEQAGLTEKDLASVLEKVTPVKVESSSKVEARLSQELGKGTDHHHLYFVNDDGQTGVHISHNVPENEVRINSDYNMGYVHSFKGGDFEKLRKEVEKFVDKTGKELQAILKNCGYK